jgi:large subunit ribosomal protein L29
MKPQEARDMSTDELTARERELTEEIFHLRLRRATSQLPNPMKVRETRRDLARVKTVLRQRTTPTPTPTTKASPDDGGGRARERSSRPTGSGGIGSAQGAKRPSTGRAPRRNK